MFKRISSVLHCQRKVCSGLLSTLAPWRTVFWGFGVCLAREPVNLKAAMDSDISFGASTCRWSRFGSFNHGLGVFLYT